MEQSSVQPPQVQPTGAGYGLGYTCYLHSMSWMLRKSVAAMTGTGALFDKTLTVPTPGLGEGHVRISVCLPKSAGLTNKPDRGPLPLILVAEGGGFVLGQPSDGEHIDRILSDQLGAVIISADYAKSPRYPFPHALLQLYEILLWATKPNQAEESLGVSLDPSRVATMGNSAGGNLTAALSLLVSFTSGPCARYREQLPKSFRQVAQVLLYPSLSCNVPYINRYNEGDEAVRTASLPVWAATLMEASYLPPHIDTRQIFIAPLDADVELLQSLEIAPVLCITAGKDCLKYEAEKYVAKLQSTKSHVEHHEVTEAIHGFSHYKKGYENDREKCWGWVIEYLQERCRNQDE